MLVRAVLPTSKTRYVPQYCPAAMPTITSLSGSEPRALLNEAAVAAAIHASTLSLSEKQKLIQNLWRALIASICHEQVRCPEIHAAGSGGLDFDNTKGRYAVLFALLAGTGL